MGFSVICVIGGQRITTDFADYHGFGGFAFKGDLVNENIWRGIGQACLTNVLSFGAQSKASFAGAPTSSPHIANRKSTQIRKFGGY